MIVVVDVAGVVALAVAAAGVVDVESLGGNRPLPVGCYDEASSLLIAVVLETVVK